MKKVWITGASSGIGKALTDVYIRDGYKVIISARNTDKLQALIESYPADIRPRITAVFLDLEQADSLAAVTAEAWKQFDGIDLLINNGGISQRSLVRDTSMSVYRRLMEVNYFGNIGLTLSLLPYFLEQGHGQIGVVSSLVGKFGSPYRSGYAASKHALHGFYDSLRAEYAEESIDVTLLCPGFIKTQVSVNALTGDGTSLNEMDDAQANGMPAEVCAELIKRALDQRKFEVNIGGRETYGVWLKRFFPLLFTKKLPSVKVR